MNWHWQSRAINVVALGIEHVAAAPTIGQVGTEGEGTLAGGMLAGGTPLDGSLLSYVYEYVYAPGGIELSGGAEGGGLAKGGDGALPYE